VKLGHEFGQPVHRREGGDVLEIGLERFRAASFDRLLIHAARVIVANFLCGRVATGRGGFEYAPQDLIIFFRELIKTAPPWTVGRNWVGRQPSAARELIKVGAGVYTLVEMCGVEA
jgi:hypothetical protein